MVAPRESRSPEISGSPSSELGLSPKGVSTKWEPTCGIPSIPRTLPTSPNTAAEATAIVLKAERVKFREEVLRKRLAYFATCLSPTACLPPASSGTRTHAGKRKEFSAPGCADWDNFAIIIITCFFLSERRIFVAGQRAPVSDHAVVGTPAGASLEPRLRRR